jgi:hypothetical protein
MRPWAARTIRAFAIVNVLLVMFGLYLLVGTVLRHYGLPPNPSAPAYYHQAFYGRSIINLLFLLALLAGSGFLWRLKRAGLTICNAVFALEILYFVGDALLDIILWMVGGKPALFAHGLAAAGGTGNMGIGPQLLTGYPIIALIALNIAYRKLHRPEA